MAEMIRARIEAELNELLDIPRSDSDTEGEPNLTAQQEEIWGLVDNSEGEDTDEQWSTTSETLTSSHDTSETSGSEPGDDPAPEAGITEAGTTEAGHGSRSIEAGENLVDPEEGPSGTQPRAGDRASQSPERSLDLSTGRDTTIGEQPSPQAGLGRLGDDIRLPDPNESPPNLWEPDLYTLDEVKEITKTQTWKKKHKPPTEDTVREWLSEHSGGSTPASNRTTPATSPEAGAQALPMARETGVRATERRISPPRQVRQREKAIARRRDRAQEREPDYSGAAFSGSRYWSGRPPGRTRTESNRLQGQPAEPQAIAGPSTAPEDTEEPPPALWTREHQRAQRDQMRETEGLAYQSDEEERDERSERHRQLALERHQRQREQRERQLENMDNRRGPDGKLRPKKK